MIPAIDLVGPPGAYIFGLPPLDLGKIAMGQGLSETVPSSLYIKSHRDSRLAAQCLEKLYLPSESGVFPSSDDDN